MNEIYLANELNQVWEAGKTGYLDGNGKPIIPVVFDEAYVLFDDYIANIEADNKASIDGGFHRSKHRKTEFILVKNAEKSGIMNVWGVEIVPCSYENIGDFFEGYSRVTFNNSRGFINKSGQLVVPCLYEQVQKFIEGYAGVKVNGKWGFIDTTGEMCISPHYEAVTPFLNGLASVKVNGLWGCIDKDANLVIPCQYNSSIHFFNEVSIASKSSGYKYGFIHKSGKELSGFDFEKYLLFGGIFSRYSIYDEYFSTKELARNFFVEGYAKVLIGGKYGFWGINGDYIPCKYDYVQDFSEGFALVEIKDRCGFINTKGEEVIPLIYGSYSDSFQGGFAKMRKEDKVVMIDKNGKELSMDAYNAQHPYNIENEIRKMRGLPEVSKNEIEKNLPPQ